MEIQIKRAYVAAEKSDGYRVLVERLWPRGVKKENLALDEWLKEIAPSPELRKWFSHDPEKWDEFQRRYQQELKTKPEMVDHLREKARQGCLTLVYAARDEQHNSALLLKEYLTRETK